MKTFVMLICWFGIAFSQSPYKAYANYDFIPGEKVLFEDNFMTSVDGEFSPHWKLYSGQAVVNKVNEQMFMTITEGSYGIVMPRFKEKLYLDGPFTVEADYIAGDGYYGLNIVLAGDADDYSRGVTFDYFGAVSTMYFPESGPLRGEYPFSDSLTPGSIVHCALVYKDRQLKCYVNQTRVLYVPDIEYEPKAIYFSGSPPTQLTNIRIASGGGMNMIDKLMKDGKIISYGITFESGKAIIKTSSMGTINEVVKVLKNKPEIRLSIEGHTDSDGDEKSNQVLSEKRAEAVKALMVEFGINSERLTAKGYGESKPVGENNSVTGKANNRRVEFVLVKQ